MFDSAVWVVVPAFLIGVVAGLRTLTAPAVVAWAAHLGWIQVDGTWFAFFANTWVRWIASVLAVGELIADQLPSTPSRTVPIQFGARIVSGALSGGALAAAGGGMWAGIVAGAVGAIVGTLGGRAARGWLADAVGRDRPAALTEDAIAIGGGLLIGAVLA